MKTLKPFMFVIILLMVFTSCQNDELLVETNDEVVESSEARLYNPPWVYVMDWRFSRETCQTGPGVCFKNDNGDILVYQNDNPDSNEVDQVQEVFEELMLNNDDKDNGVIAFKREDNTIRLVFSRELEEENFILGEEIVVRSDISKELGEKEIVLPAGEYKIDRTRFKYGETVVPIKMNIQEREVIINHMYNYYGKQFKVSYTYNQEEDQVLKTEGDIEMAEEIFGNNGETPKSLFFNNSKEGSTDIEVDVFDNQEDLKLYASKLAGKPLDEEENENAQNKGNCTSYDNWGLGNFYFYKHINYNTSMSGMNRLGRYYYRDHWVGSSYNDQLSSLFVTKKSDKKAIVYLYQHSCFDGRIIGFYQQSGYSGFGISNLKWFTMSGWWWWKESWNDQVSSTSGWAW